MELDEERINHICECENCGYYPLKHLEKCPKCKSEAFNTYPPRKHNEDSLEEDLKQNGNEITIT